MTVYVDNMMAKYGNMIMCHLIADSEAELHAMADKIGVARKWYQGNHYDIALSKRKLAVLFGAVEITQRQCALMIANMRDLGLCTKPEDAERVWKEHRPNLQFINALLVRQA